MRGNTITLSNFGMIGGKYAAPRHRQVNFGYWI